VKLVPIPSTANEPSGSFGNQFDKWLALAQRFGRSFIFGLHKRNSMDFQINETVKLKQNGELVEIYLIKDKTLIVYCQNYKTTSIPEELEVPFDAVEKFDLPPVSTYRDHE